MEIVKLAAAGANSPDPAMKLMAMCLSTVGMAGIADKMDPRGFEAELVQLCSRLGDDIKVMLSGMGMSMDSVGGVEGIIKRSQERSQRRASGDEPFWNPADPEASLVLNLIDRLTVGNTENPDPMNTLAMIHLAVGMRMASMRSSADSAEPCTADA